MKSINPATNEIIKEYTDHTPEEVTRIIDQVNKKYLAWRNFSIPERAKLMFNAAAVLRKNRNKYAKTMSLEMGKTITESRAEIEKCAWVCDYYAENAKNFLADEIVETDAGKSFVAFQPIGIVLAIMPWNFPFWQVFRFAAPTLMAGNAAILKHASNVPGSAIQIEEVFHEAGFPENLFRTLLIGANQVEAVIKNDKVKAITLTGSEPAGMQVASTAGHELKKTVLELGGSDPYVVLDDAEIDICANTAVTARMINTGQSCIAAKRFIVVESILESFLEKHVMRMKSLKMGDPMNENTQVGAMARMDLLEELDKQVQKSIEMGATLLTGGKKADGPGTFYLPTVLNDVKKGMPAYNEEIFGPVSVIIPVEDTEEAIAVANDSEFGLGGSVWSKNLEKAEEVARRIEVGAVFVNGMTKSDPRLPFGGIKKSGYGRELSHYGIKEFVNIKTIWIA